MLNIDIKNMENYVDVIIINGSGGVGKDEFVNICKKLLEKTSNSIIVKNISSVDNVKKAAKILGWDGKKNEEDRKFLSDLKDLSTKYNNGPTSYMFEKYLESLEIANRDRSVGFHSHIIIFYHIREPEEIKSLVEIIPFSNTLLIESNRVKKIESNHADANIRNYNYDYIIQNNGTLADLEAEAIKFLNTILNKEN